MKTKLIVSIFAMCFVAVAVCFAADPHLGIWKLNEGKSKLSPEGAKNHSVIYKMEGDNVTVIVDGVDKDAKAVHTEWTGKYDGKDYPVKGDPTSDMRSYTKVDDNTLKIAIKKGGNVTAEGTITVTADGKTRTVTINATNSKGEKVTTEAVYDKQ